MLADVSLDLGTVALLAFVVWLDGWRRMPADGVLVAKAGFGSWAVRQPWTRAGAFALVAWWEPVVLPVLLGSAPAEDNVPVPRWRQDFQVATARASRRLRRARANIGFLRGLGILLIAWIIVGIPFITALLGGRGLIIGVIGAFGLAMEIAMIAMLSLRMLGMPNRVALRTAAQFLSPFGAPRAASVVTATAADAFQSLAPVAALLGHDRFVVWLRPWAYDVLAGRDSGADDDVVARFARLLPRFLLERAVVAPPGDRDSDEARFCPRCARGYREAVTACSDCDGLALINDQNCADEAAFRPPTQASMTWGRDSTD